MATQAHWQLYPSESRDRDVRVSLSSALRVLKLAAADWQTRTSPLSESAALIGRLGLARGPATAPGRVHAGPPGIIRVRVGPGIGPSN